MELPAGLYNVTYAQDMAIVRTRLQWLITVVAGVVLFTVPLYASNYVLGVMNQIGILVIATLGIQILIGYAGQVSIGHAAFFAVGAYTCAILTGKLGCPFVLALICSGISAGIIGALFGGPSLRIKGFYLVMSTLAAHVVILYIIGHWPELTGGMVGLAAPPAEILGFKFNTEPSFYYLVMVVLVIATLAAVNLVRTKAGRAFVAIRDNDLAANVMGINVWYVKLQAFFVGCFFAGIAGGLYAPWIGMLTPTLFPLMNGIWYLGYIVLGGIGTITGAFFGVAVVVILREGLNLLVTSFAPELVTSVTAISDVVFGLVLALTLIYEPRGIAHAWSTFKNYYRLWPLAR